MSTINLFPFGGDSEQVAANVEAIEKAIDLPIPEPLRSLLLDMNGAVLKAGTPGEAAMFPDVEMDASVDYIVRTEQLLQFYEGYYPVGSWIGVDPSFMPFAVSCSGDWVVGLYGEYRGCVYFFDRRRIPDLYEMYKVEDPAEIDPKPVSLYGTKVASSLNEFFELLVPLSTLEQKL